jgi:hypothetical protein
MADFHNTVMGKRFYEHHIPELIRNLERIADALEVGKKEEKIGSSFSAVTKFIEHYPNDADLGKKIRETWS